MFKPHSRNPPFQPKEIRDAGDEYSASVTWVKTQGGKMTEEQGGWTAASPTAPPIPDLTSLRRGDRAPAFLRVLTRDPTAQGVSDVGHGAPERDRLRGAQAERRSRPPKPAPGHTAR